MIRHQLSRFYSRITHGHGNIDKNGKIGNASGKIITTGENGVLQASNSISKNQINDFPTTLPPANHTHTKNQITDFNHTHTKNQITDFSHTHTKNQITDFSHSHGDVTNDGKITSSDTENVKKAVVTDNNNNLKVISKIPFSNLNITKANITGLGIPSQDTNTTYSAGTGLTLQGNSFKVDDAPATEVIHNTSEASLPNLAPGVSNAQIPQQILNQIIDTQMGNHKHIGKWEEISVPKGMLFVNQDIGLAEYLYDGSLKFTAINTDTPLYNGVIIPSEYTPKYRTLTLAHLATAGLTIAILDVSGRVRCRSYSASTKGLSIHFLYRYKKAGEQAIDDNVVSL